ncbi:unnamed protein product, partial [Allacma fusca]
GELLLPKGIQLITDI